ncbi:amidohydrolase family protein [Nonomuraea purpurea]|uniref:Amidohydrolase family protein n=1 Tax=Nonomuraea purpurea TaxID=1849276 RepID=A0ABV8GGI7_9ACTN
MTAHDKRAPVVVRHATIITGRDQEVIEDGRVVADGDRIVEVGPDTGAVPSGATVLDATGCTVLPGLHNLHDHVARKTLRFPDGTGVGYRGRGDVLMRQPLPFLAYHTAANLAAQLRSGVTTIRDFGLPGITGIQAMRAVAEGIIPGPRLIAGGDPICITGGHASNWGAMEADGPVGVVTAVRKQIIAGAAVLKFMGSGGLGTYPEEDPGIPELGPDELAAGIAEAHKFRKRTATHAYSTEAIMNAVVAGTDTVEHGAFMDDTVVAAMLERGTAFVPTLSSVIAIAFQHRLVGDMHLYQRILDDIVGPHMAGVALAWKAGVPVATGTDTNGEVVEELELIAEATGASVLEVLPSATRVAAEVAGLAGVTGVLEPGLAAEVLVADGDVIKEGLEVLRRPRWVLRSGTVHAGAPLPLGIRLSQLRN